jgi:hypothetical protein
VTGWRVDPAGLNRILTDTNAAVQGVSSALAGPAESVGDVQGAAGYDGIVLSAYAGFMQELFDGTVTRMFERYSSALEGTANAANAYLAGDEQIAATIASAMSASDFGAALYSQGQTGPGGSES